MGIYFNCEWLAWSDPKGPKGTVVTMVTPMVPTPNERH